MAAYAGRAVARGQLLIGANEPDGAGPGIAPVEIAVDAVEIRRHKPKSGSVDGNKSGPQQAAPALGRYMLANRGQRPEPRLAPQHGQHRVHGHPGGTARYHRELLRSAQGPEKLTGELPAKAPVRGEAGRQILIVANVRQHYHRVELRGILVYDRLGQVGVSDEHQYMPRPVPIEPAKVYIIRQVLRVVRDEDGGSVHGFKVGGVSPDSSRGGGPL